MLRTTSLAVATAIALAGCASAPVQKIPVAISGSKADGIVRMSYEEGFYENVTVDWASGDANALKRCSAWGYTKVETFAGGNRTCIERGQGVFNGVPVGQCAVWKHTKDYQCTD